MGILNTSGFFHLYLTMPYCGELSRGGPFDSRCANTWAVQSLYNDKGIKDEMGLGREF